MSTKKTHSEYVAEIAVKNPTVEIIGHYINAKTLILHKCKICGHEWNASPNSILSGHGCGECFGTKKKTSEEYINELALKNPNIEVVDDYIDAKTKIRHRCKKHNVMWNTSPSSVLKGCGCPQCCSEKIRDSLVKSHMQYVEELFIANPNVEVLGQYINSKTPILHRCKIDNHTWNVAPSNLLNGQGCPICSNHIERTYDEYVSELSVKNPNIKIIGEYQGCGVPTMHYCQTHDIQWMAIPYNVLKGRGCKLCCSEKISQALVKHHDEYVDDVKIKNPNIEVIGEYIDSKTPILHFCKIHNIEWMSRPYNILSGKGCRLCCGDKISKKLKKDTEWYIQRLKEIRPTLELVDEYVDNGTPIYHRCKIDGYIWKISPHNVLSGTNCPKCGGYSGEKCVAEWLDKNQINYIKQYRFNDCCDKKQLPFDFYLPDQRCAIEYDGQQHFMPIDFAGKGEEWSLNQLQITQFHDKIKTEYCMDNDISLLRIRYDENIEDRLNSFIHLI